MTRLVPLAAAVLIAASITGCTAKSTAKPATTHTITSTVVSTLPGADPNAFTPAPATSVNPLPPGAKPAKGEKEKLCPYLRTGLDQDPTSKPNAADLQGNRIYRTTVLTGLTPVGCRFYFYSGPFEAVADILPRTFATPTEAHNAMVRTARAGIGAQSYPAFAPGVDGISYRTKFFGPNGANDWAFVFAKGKVMVVVHTEEKTTSQDARNVAGAIVAKF